MGIPTSEVGYTSATTGRGDDEVHDGHVVALDLKKILIFLSVTCDSYTGYMQKNCAVSKVNNKFISRLARA
jgi:hypothetical protein